VRGGLPDRPSHLALVARARAPGGARHVRAAAEELPGGVPVLAAAARARHPAPHLRGWHPAGASPAGDDLLRYDPAGRLGIAAPRWRDGTRAARVRVELEHQRHGLPHLLAAGLLLSQIFPPREASNVL